MSLRDHLVRYADAPGDWTPTWVIEHIWQHFGVNFLSGPPKVARKSTLRRYLTACAITGHEPFGLFAVRTRSSKALSIIVEDHPGRERNIIDTICASIGYRQQPHVDFLTPLGFHLDNPNHLKELVRLTDEEGYDLITIDPLIEFHNADENSSHEMSKVAIALRLLATKACVVVVHHTAKPPQEGTGWKARTIGEQMRGSGVLGGMANVSMESRRTGPGRVKLRVEGKELPEDIEPFEVTVDPETWLWSQEESLSEVAVYETIKAAPGLTRNELVKVLHRGRNSVLWIIKSLLQQQLVREERSKEGCRLYVC